MWKLNSLETAQIKGENIYADLKQSISGYKECYLTGIRN